MSFLNAILQERDESVGIKNATFQNLEDVYQYLETVHPSKPYPRSKPPLIISEGVYQYVLDNEDKIKHVVCGLQDLFHPLGFLTDIDIPTLSLSYMACMTVDEYLEEDEFHMQETEEEENSATKE